MNMRRRALLAQMNAVDVVGLQVDFENNTFRRLAGARGRSPGADFDCFAPFGGRRRCCVADDGTVNAFYGQAGYAEDGTAGQVMVYQPKFYYRTEPLILSANPSGTGSLLKKVNYYISPTPKPGFRLHPAFFGRNGEPIDYLLCSAYEAAYYDASLGRCFSDGTDTGSRIDFEKDRLCSLPDKKPIAGVTKNLTRSNAEALANARGRGWHIETVKSCAANQMLMAVEFGTMDLQSALGEGIVSVNDQMGVNCAALTGSTAAAGNASGVAAETVLDRNGVQQVSSAKGHTAVAYRGQENPWGNLWKHIAGINLYYPAASAPGQVYIVDDYAFAEEKKTENYHSAGFVLPTDNGAIRSFGYGGPEYDWLLLPGSTDADSAGPVGDNVSLTQSTAGYKVIQYGGRWDYAANAGPFCGNYQRATNYCSRAFGCRLIFVP